MIMMMMTLKTSHHDHHNFMLYRGLSSALTSLYRGLSINISGSQNHHHYHKNCSLPSSASSASSPSSASHLFLRHVVISNLLGLLHLLLGGLPLRRQLRSLPLRLLLLPLRDRQHQNLQLFTIQTSFRWFFSFLSIFFLPPAAGAAVVVVVVGATVVVVVVVGVNKSRMK